MKLAECPQAVGEVFNVGSTEQVTILELAQRVLQQLKAQAVPARPLGAMIGVVVGAGLLAFGLLAEGGIVLVLLGAALLWHNLRKLERARRAAQASPAQQVGDVFSGRPPARGGGA